MGFYRGPHIVTDGLVLALDAANTNSYPGTGTAWTDLSGNNNNGTLTNGPAFNSENGGGIVFDGTNDYVALGTPASLNILGNTTINVWINVTSFPTNADPYDTIYTKGYNGTNEHIVFRLQPETIYIGTYNNTLGERSTSVSHSGLITLGKWVYLTGQYDTNAWKIYVNGDLKSSTVTNQGSYSSTAPCSIGAGFITNTYTRFLNSRISNIQVYNRALTQAEIQQNYNATKSRFNL